MMAKFVEAKLKKDKPEYVGEILKSLLEIPEYREAARLGAGPRLFTGSAENRAGKIAAHGAYRRNRGKSKNL